MDAAFHIPPLAEMVVRDRAPPAPPGEKKPRRKTVRGPVVADISAENLVAVIDTAEQLPLDLSPLRTEWKSLETGDYSICGLENYAAIERKSLPDFVACCGVERERFSKCVQRLLAYPCRAIVVEASYEDLERGGWRSKITPASVIGSYYAWLAMGVPIVLSGDRQRAGRDVVSLLVAAGRRRWSEARELITAAQRIETSELCEEIL